MVELLDLLPGVVQTQAVSGFLAAEPVASFLGSVQRAVPGEQEKKRQH